MTLAKEIPRFALLLLLVFASNSFTQENRDPFQNSGLTREQRADIVGRILRWYTAPSSKPRVVPLLADGIDPARLPAIKNIEFRLIPLHRSGEFDHNIRFFYPLEREGRTMYIGFGSGDPECDSSNETWAYRIDRGRVRLWPTGLGWGTGCGGSSTPPKIPNLRIGAVSPNELPGYEFFKKGKLQNIRLGVSRREDMIALFGSTCEGASDYDQNWSIWVNYFEKGNGGSVSVGEEKTNYFPKDEYVGTLRFIHLIPKNTISFAKVLFPAVFYRGESYAIGDCWSETGFCGAVHSTIIHYEDSYGLTYEVFDKETFRNTPGKNTSKKGDLVGIEYEIPNAYESGIYRAVREPAEMKMSPKN